MPLSSVGKAEHAKTLPDTFMLWVERVEAVLQRALLLWGKWRWLTGEYFLILSGSQNVLFQKYLSASAVGCTNM